MSKQISVKNLELYQKTARRTLMSMRYNRIISYGRGALPKLIEKSTEVMTPSNLNRVLLLQ